MAATGRRYVILAGCSRKSYPTCKLGKAGIPVSERNIVKVTMTGDHDIPRLTGTVERRYRDLVHVEWVSGYRKAPRTRPALSGS